MIILRNKTYSFIGNSIRAAGGFLFGSILGSVPTYLLTGSKKASLIAGAIMGTWVARNEIKLAQEAKAEEEMGKQELEQIKAKNKNKHRNCINKCQLVIRGKTDKCIKEQKAYVKRYAEQHGITVEKALEHEIVKNVIEWMKLRDKENSNET